MAIKIVKDANESEYFTIKCEYCGCEFQYQLTDLGYRPWYPHGFVYCPHCHKPLRHQGDK